MPKRFTVPELYDRLKIDDLYFEATNGGVTFGGGEPLLQAPFIRAFIDFVRGEGKRWRFAVETSLAVPEEALRLLLPEDGPPLVSEWIVDCKDMDEEVYHRYTGGDGARMKENLRLLLSLVGPDRVTVRVPLIPEYNTPEHRTRSVEALKAMGVTKFDVFEYVIREK